MIFQYIKNFLSERCICTRVGKTYSSIKNIDLAYRRDQLLLLSYLLFLLNMIFQKHYQKSLVAQYADHIAIWINTTLRMHTNKRVVNYVQMLYQSELNKLIIYMKENGLELSGEKTCLILFNNGENPKRLPRLELHGQILNYKQNTSFWGYT